LFSRLFYNQTDHTTRNNDGVETRIPGFGNSSAVEYINPYKSSYAEYFSKIADGLISLGYERGINLHGAPYDFRKAASM
jgi:lysophospholipase-3